jgi:transcriptional regulator with XRE-family HTH domain
MEIAMRACPGARTTEADLKVAARRFLSRALSNRPLQRTGANVPLSVDSYRAGAARLFKNTVGRRAAPAVLLSTTSVRPLPLNGTPLGALMEVLMANVDPDYGPSEFGIWLHDTRTKKNMSPGELAEKAGISFVQVYNIEAGRSQNPREGTRNRLITALGTKPAKSVLAATEKGASIEDVGELADFDPHDDRDLPEEPGIYVFYDISDRPVYVGQSQNIRQRIRNDHASRFWYKQPFVETAAYVKIDDQPLRKKIEKIMIKFMRSTAVVNRHHVERDGA